MEDRIRRRNRKHTTVGWELEIAMQKPLHNPRKRNSMVQIMVNQRGGRWKDKRPARKRARYN